MSIPSDVVVAGDNKEAVRSNSNRFENLLAMFTNPSIRARPCEA
jgi:hypothetical protein